ncbi:LysR family transcriptional regulator [Arenibaculum sp.]|jgi:DNA-binding transcriptional LysR family regulator|uniref:LysR family transcriptional regulator n=1 Tax=Arenibaculum sp. TaxID=2865862 RepID=UPI002E12590F|nr:LysR substrate-binding domain-containing protein [Arenibaculum sp.]
MSNLPDLSARQLKAVTAVARYSSFIAAAVELRMSQPGLSRIIRTVEEELGVALFHRNTRHVGLTAAGAEFVPIAERILHDLELGTEAIRGLAGQARGHVAIACPMSFAQTSLIGIAADYRRRHPNVRLQIKEGIQSAIREDILAGVVDFGIGFVREPSDNLVVDALQESCYYVVFHKDHPFSEKASVSLREIGDETLVSLPPSATIRQIFDGTAASAGFRLDHAITVNTYTTVFEFVRAQVGVAILPDPGIPAPTDPVLRARPIGPPRFRTQLAVLSLRSRSLSPAAVGLKRLIHAHFAHASGGSEARQPAIPRPRGATRR